MVHEVDFWRGDEDRGRGTSVRIVTKADQQLHLPLTTTSLSCAPAFYRSPNLRGITLLMAYVQIEADEVRVDSPMKTNPF